MQYSFSPVLAIFFTPRLAKDGVHRRFLIMRHISILALHRTNNYFFERRIIRAPTVSSERNTPLSVSRSSVPPPHAHASSLALQATIAAKCELGTQ